MAKKTVWVTGASSGIGKALCEVYAEKGWNVVLSARRESELVNVKEHLSAGDHHVLPLDLVNTDELPQKVETAWDFNQRIDLILHCGGISQRGKAVECPISVDRRVMEIDYFGTIALTKALVPKMVKNGGGQIGVITSLVGKFGTPYRSAYAAAKHALHGFFDSLRAEEHDNNIRVSLILPGFIKTNVSVNALTESGEKLNEMDDAQANGMSPEQCAAIIYKNIQKEKQEFLIGGKEVLGVYLKRFVPKLFSKIIRNTKVR